MALYFKKEKEMVSNEQHWDSYQPHDNCQTESFQLIKQLLQKLPKPDFYNFGPFPNVSLFSSLRTILARIPKRIHPPTTAFMRS